MTDVVIVAAARTPIGAFNGALSTVPGPRPGCDRHQGAAEARPGRCGRGHGRGAGPGADGGQGQNPARQAAIKAGIPIDKTAITINQVCGSGLRAVAMGYQAIKAGDAAVIIAGGQESMSLSTHCAHLRNGQKMGSLELVDTMIKDGLWDAFNGYHMGTTAENVAQKWQITREQQDAFAAGSQQKARGRAEGRPVQGRDRPVTVKSAQGRRPSSTATSTPSTGRRPRRWPSCARPSARTARSRPAMRRASTTVRRASC